MALLIQLGITDVSLLTGYPKTTHPKCMVVCIHLYAHTARLVLAIADFVEELQVVLHQTGVIIGQEYRGLNPETSLKTKLTLQHSGNLSSEITSLRQGQPKFINGVRMRNDWSVSFAHLAAGSSVMLDISRSCCLCWNVAVLSFP